MSIILITHDMGVIAEMCDRVAVMYAGFICEIGDIMIIFKSPYHPYTRGLLSAIPRPDAEREDLQIIRGAIPNLINPPSACRFHPRCDYHMIGLCESVLPDLIEIEPGHLVRCHLYSEEGKAWMAERGEKRVIGSVPKGIAG